uniref:ATP synthase F0 subunit 8 n=1 Tax=Seriana sp. 'barna' TaxID=3003638 RepID=A0A9E9EJG1_9HEMI|nr:ATP synthase F0 subunit 8 [Seriana bacilla]WAM61614.1 ATP synthase F0 subunit 8 [Seriana sp. 'barna']WOR80600.1 ATP synthase F0 subunit 8 [Seriana bacilla]
MPQMSPMWWTSLMLTFIVIFIILMTTLYYFYNEKMTGNISIPINKINWKW